MKRKMRKVCDLRFKLSCIFVVIERNKNELDACELQYLL